ncbi:TetR/AcrR family transcriptional regulator [Micromonospora polyrhachis]|uniref:AcrR family transcriptional regulator n=1 Tax=Micromonospora polyrhachis TaxID=1282883 RepID=A0A7W7SRX9_9ACTN|nr:helix-turn-helix domain-containing protein [Micromonospora polyrhachis]MBB4959834.1 AcrR family transcriptional regulator [Micromonospora polyrhachis]
MAATIAMIDREGYAAATTERIAKQAETSKGTLLYHFKSREAIDEAVVRALYDNGAAYMTTRITAVASSRDRLRAYLSSNLRFIAENTAHVNAVHRILDNTGAHIDIPDGVPGLRQLLTSGQLNGEFDSFDVEVMALSIRAVVDAASRHFAANPNLDVDHYIDQASRIFDKATTS